MATRALLIDHRRLLRYQDLAVNRVTRCAGNLAPGMAALNPPRVRRLIQMAFEAGLVHLDGLELGRIPDLLRRSGFGVLAAGAMAGFASLAVPPALFVALDGLMRALLNRVESIFVASLAHLGADVGRRLIYGGLGVRWRGLRMDLTPQQNHAQECG
jgi:hypothetical protein